LKPARLRPLAKQDRKGEVRYYRHEAGERIAIELIEQTGKALKQIEQEPGMGSPRLGQLADVLGLRSWRVKGFPLVWLYFEREKYLDVVRLLGERQDILAILWADQ
jgi:toxin ParE1/3/4